MSWLMVVVYCHVASLFLVRQTTMVGDMGLIKIVHLLVAEKEGERKE